MSSTKAQESCGVEGKEHSAVFARHRGPVTCAAAVPNSRSVVTSGYDSAVALFQLDSSRVELLGYHGHLVNRITIDCGGTRAASCSSDYTIGIWDVPNRRLSQVLLGHTDDVEDFAFIDERTGVSASRDHRVIVWDLQTGRIVRVLEGHEKDVLSVAYCDGKVYSSGDDMTLREWDMETGLTTRTWGPFEQETDTCAIDPVCGRAILGCDDGVVRLFKVATGELMGEIHGHAHAIKKVAASPVSGDILSAAYDRRVLVWDAVTLKQKAELEHVPSLWERSLNWSPDGTKILAGTFDGTVLEWSAESGRRLLEAGGTPRVERSADPDGRVGNACFNDLCAAADGTVVLVSDDGYIRAGHLSATGAEWTARIEPAQGRILMNAVTLDANRGRIIAGAHNHSLFFYQVTASGLKDEEAVELGEGPINCIRIAEHPGFYGDAFAACYSSAIVRVGADRKIKGQVKVHEGAVKSLRIHPTVAAGISCGADGLLLSWELGGALLERFPGHTAIVDDVDFDPTGEYVASVSRDFKLNVYRFADGRLLHSIPLGHRSPKSVCYLDPTTVIVGDYWGALIRVDLATARRDHKIIARNGISSLFRGSDFVIAASYDGGVYLVRSGDLVVQQTLRAMTQRPEFASAAGPSRRA